MAQASLPLETLVSRYGAYAEFQSDAQPMPAGEKAPSPWGEGWGEGNLHRTCLVPRVRQSFAEICNGKTNTRVYTGMISRTYTR